MNRSEDHGSKRRIVLLLVVCSIVALTVWAFGRSSRSPETSDTILLQARAALSDGRFAESEELAKRINKDDPLWTESRLLAGSSAVRDERYEDAIEDYLEISDDDSPDGLTAVYSLGEVYRQVGALSKSIECYQRVLEKTPDNFEAHQRLTFLLGTTGQLWETTPHFMAMIRGKTITLNHLALFADLDRPYEQRAYLEQCAKKYPDDPLVVLGLASHSLFEGAPVDAKRGLQVVVEREPTLLAAQAKLGELFVLEDAQTYLTWLNSLPDSASQDPNIWFVRGLWYRRQNELEAAARCFWETIRFAPTHRRGMYQLCQVLVLLDLPEQAEFTTRSTDFFKLTQHLDHVLKSKGKDEKAARLATFVLQRTGRLWEAWAWASISRSQYPEVSWPAEIIEEVAPLLRPSLPRTIDSENLALKHDFSKFRLPEKGDSVSPGTRPNPIVSRSNAKIRFENETASVGIAFTYFNGDEDLDKPGARMFEQTGGGVGVIDFDLDRWPDLIFTQGSPWPEGSNSPTPDPNYSNICYRNKSGSRFEDVSQAAGLDDLGFGQGISVGDFNNDGFPDLYVANIGRNLLYRNNGDGTFDNVSREAGLDAEQWTSSCLIADLNADGFPDMFDVNYLEGKDVFTVRCRGQACSPGIFQGASDRLSVARGDGTFESISNATPRTDSKSLGVVALALDEPQRLSLFISIDQVPNHLLKNRAIKQWPFIELVDEGLVRGVAYNEDGLTMACMGIAAGDADGNGLYDLFVTNFEDEANTLYLQDRGGWFADSSRIAGLATPSLAYVGWGTQFLDAELDGDLDLVLVNGHVEDHRPEGGLFHMPAQFFVNHGQTRFSELDASASGSIFQQNYLGRGLSRLDWNRDGRMDFVLSNINGPAALATNRTSDVGHWFNVRLSATETARDAIGASVTLTCDGMTSTQQLLAGDGYMASNERMLQFGLGPAGRIEKLVIHWPSGGESSLSDLPVDVTLELVENSQQATLWQAQEPLSFEVNE